MSEEVDARIRELVELYYQTHLIGVLPAKDKEESLKPNLDPEDAKWRLGRVVSAMDIDGLRMLDVGCGMGAMLAQADKVGANVWGVEPDPMWSQIAKIRLPDDQIASGVGEALPFKDGSFDRVTMMTILEHVADPFLTLVEGVRVLRTGGKLLVWVPNYACMWEAHYNLFLPFFLPRSILKWYLVRRGRRTDFLDHINFVTSWGIERMLSRLDVDVENLGQEEWHSAVAGGAKFHSGVAERAFALTSRLKLTWFMRLLGKMGIYTPLVYVCTKRG